MKHILQSFFLRATQGVLVVVFFLTSCSSKKEPLSPPPIPVTTTHPVVKEVSFSIKSLGKLLPNAQAEIFPKTEGAIITIFVHEGQFVERGTPLFLVDPTIQKIDVQKKHAEINEKAAELTALQKKLDRYSSLSRKDLISKSELEELEANVEKAKQNLLLSHLVSEEAALTLEWCTIRAPITGRVGKIDYTPGIHVKKDTHLTTLTQTNPLIVECSLTEREISLAKASTILTVTPLASPEIKKEGTLTFFDNSFDEKRGVMLVRGLIPNEETPTLLPGQIVVTHIPYRVEQKAILIPQQIISYNQEGAYVYTVKEDRTIEISQLVLGEEFGEERIVLEGLTPESEIIIESGPRLFPGCSVTTDLAEKASS